MAANNPRVLIVYFSRTGNTRAVARDLARASGADLECIEAMTPRRGLAGYLLSGYEATFEREARIHPPRYSPRSYDIVLVGTPTWSAAVSSPIRAYLMRFAGSFPELGFFVTCGGRGAERVVEQMSALAGKDPLGVLKLRERDLKQRPAVYLGEFWETVLSAWEKRHLSHAAQ